MTAKSTSVGKQTEQMVARWLREHGFPHAERTVRTGYRTTARTLADSGDIDGCPGLCWQVKSLRPADRAERAVPEWMAETDDQRTAVRADVGVLIVRRWGTTDVGRWWCFLRLGTVLALHGSAAPGHGDTPVRMELRHAVAWLRLLGYGEPIELAS